MSPTLRFGNALAVTAIVLVLAIVFGLQFVLHELPCPLCYLQRIACALCGLGFVLNLRFGAQPGHYGLVLLGALFGIAASGRQVLLNVQPGVTAWGAPVAGLHLYAWAMLFFLAMILVVALLMMLSGSGRFDHLRSDAQAAARFAGFPRLMSYVLIVLTLANAVVAFAQCGPVNCADNPTTYWIVQYLPAFMR